MQFTKRRRTAWSTPIIRPFVRKYHINMHFLQQDISNRNCDLWCSFFWTHSKYNWWFWFVYIHLIIKSNRFSWYLSNSYLSRQIKHMTRSSNNNKDSNHIIIPSIFEPKASSKNGKAYRNLSRHKFTEYEKAFLCECYLNGSKSVIAKGGKSI